MKLKNVAITLLLIASSLAPPTSIAGQSNNWMGVRAIPKGTDLIVEQKSDERVAGILQAVTGDSLAITSDEGSFIIGRDNVTKIYHAIPRNKKKTMNRGATYGMVAGLGVGVAIAWIRVSENEEMPWVGPFLAGGGIGAWVGSLRAKGKDKGPLLYSAK